MKTKLELAQAAHRSAVERLHAAQRAIDEANAEDESTDLDALGEEFDTAAAEVERCSENLAKAEKRAKLISDNPIPEAEEAPEPVVEEREQPRTGRIEVTREELTYDRHKDVSYFQDLYLANKLSDPMATERLARHRREMVGHLKKERGLKTFRAINETSGTGGEFVPPLWLNQQYIEFLRAARATADVVNHMPLPEHTNSINFPSLSGGTSTAAQLDGGSVSSTDVTTSSVNVPVKTIAGQQDMARQLLERSVPGMDQVLMQDLMADYNKQLDVQVLNGGGGASATGILNTSSIGSVTYTDASPAFGGDGKMAAQIGSAVNTVSSNRFLPPDVIVMSPRRWYWIVSRSDTTNRPLVVPEGQAVNAVGIAERVTAQARAGTLFGLPVVIDPNVPTTISTNQDPILVMRAQDLWLMEDSAGPYTRVYEEVLSGTLQIRVQLFNYFAFTAARYPSSVCKILGTGLAAPSF